MTLSPGIHRLQPDEYHNGDALRWHLSSTIGRKLINQSPAHAMTAMTTRFDTKAFRFGRAVHLKVLGAGSPVTVIPDDLLSSGGGIRTKAAKEWKSSREEEGLTVIKRDEATLIDTASAAATGHLADAGIFLSPMCSEVVAVGEIDGIKIKAMVDNAPENEPVLWDVKTTENAHPDAIERAVINYGYDFQAAHYTDVWKAATGEDRVFRFLFIEKSEPFAACIVELGQDTLEMARKKTKRAREIMAECITSGEWPSYPPGVVRLNMPEWFHTKWLDREAAEIGLGSGPSPAALRAAYEMQAPMEAAE